MIPVSVGGRRAATSLVLLTALGCQTHNPEPLVPLDELRLLEERGRTILERREREPASTEWFPLAAQADPSDGLTVAECNTFALWNAPGVVQSWQNRSTAEARLIGAGLYRNPTLSLSPVLSSSGTGALIPVQLTWPLPLFGVRSANEDAAREALEASELRIVDAELQALTEVRRSAIQIWFDARTVEALTDASDRLAALTAQLRALSDAGSLDAVTLWTAERQLAQLTDRRLAAELTLQNDERALRRTLGLLPSQELTFDFDASVLELPDAPTDDEAAPEARLLALPGLRALEAVYRTREAELRREIAEQYPQIALGPAAELDRGEDLFGAAASVELPLLELNEGGIATALTARTTARIAYRQALLDATHARAQSLATVSTLEDRLEVVRRLTTERSESTERALQNRVGSGLAEASTLINATTQLFQLRLDQIELERQWTVNRFQAAVRSGHPLVLDQDQEADQ